MKKLPAPHMSLKNALKTAETVSKQAVPQNPKDIVIRGALLTLANRAIDTLNEEKKLFKGTFKE